MATSISETEKNEFQQVIMLLRSKEESLKQMRESIKTARADLAPLQSKVMQFMEAKGVQSCNLGQCRMVIEERNRMPPISWRYLESEILPRFLDESRMNEMKRVIEEDRRSKMTTVRTIVQKPIKQPRSAAAHAPAPAAMPVPMPPAVVAAPPQQHSLHASISDLYA